MSALDQTLATIRERIGQHQGRGISEQAAKTALVNPLLRALGWDTEDLHQVYPEYSSAGGRVDYALLIDDGLRLLIEAKTLDAKLDDLKNVTQLTTYAVTTGVRLTVLTNGDEYRIYNSHAEVPLAEKLFQTVRLSDRDPRAAEILSLLSRDAVRDNRLDARWQQELEHRRLQRVNQQLQTTLQALVDQDPPNESLIRLLLKQPGCQLAPGDIREGLRRARVQFELSPDIPPPRNPVDPVPPEPQQRVGITLRHLIEAGILKPPLEIHTTYKLQRHTALVEPDGAVVFQDNRYRTPSGAGRAVKDLHGISSTGGVAVWTFWKFTDADGQIKPLGVMRQRFLEGSGADVQPPSPSRRPSGSRVSLEHLIEAEILKPPLDIHVTLRGQRFTARIEVDGVIVFQGKRYTTPSGAGGAVRALRGNYPASNGWVFWSFTDADGRDQPLSVLRDRYLEQRAPE